MLYPLLICLLLVSAGCEDDERTGPLPLTNNEISSQWVGVYEGRGSYTAVSAGIHGKEVDAVVWIQDLGENSIRVELNIAGEPTYSPPIRLNMPVDNSNACTYETTVEGTLYHVAIALLGATRCLHSTMYVIGAGGGATWQIGLTACRVD